MRCLDSSFIGRVDRITAADPTSVGIERSASQYDVADRVLDCLTFDVTNNPWRTGGIFDAIVTDPPCAFRGALYTLDEIR